MIGLDPQRSPKVILRSFLLTPLETFCFLRGPISTGLSIPVWLVSSHSWVLGTIMILRTDDDRSPRRDVMVQLCNPWATGWLPSNTGVISALPQLTVAVHGTLASLSQYDTVWISKFTITVVECRSEFTSFNSAHLRVSDVLYLRWARLPQCHCKTPESDTSHPMIRIWDESPLWLPPPLLRKPRKIAWANCLTQRCTKSG